MRFALGRADTAACQRFTLVERLRHREPRRLHEIDGDQRGDVGDRIAVAGDEFAAAKLAVEQFEKPGDARLVGLGPFRQLRHFQLLHRRMQMAEHRGDAET